MKPERTVSALGGIVEVVPNAYGDVFPRRRVRGPLWYERAARRYVGNLARRNRWIWAEPQVDVEHNPASRRWDVHISWHAANSPNSAPAMLVGELIERAR